MSTRSRCAGRQVPQWGGDDFRRRRRVSQAVDPVRPRGKTTRDIKSVAAKDPSIVEIGLAGPYAPLLARLAFSNGAAAIVEGGPIANPLQGVPRQGTVQAQGAPARPVYSAGALDGIVAQGPPGGYAGAREALSTRCGSCRYPMRPRASRARSPGSTSSRIFFRTNMIDRLEDNPACGRSSSSRLDFRSWS